MLPDPVLVVPSVTSTVAVATRVLSKLYRAVMIVVPTPTAVTRPVGETVATVDFNEPHCT